MECYRTSDSYRVTNFSLQDINITNVDHKSFKVIMLLALLLALSTSRSSGSRRRRHNTNAQSTQLSDPLSDLEGLSGPARERIMRKFRKRVRGIAAEEAAKFQANKRKTNMRNTLKLGMMQKTGIPAASLISGDLDSMMPLFFLFDKDEQEFMNKNAPENSKDFEQIIKMLQ